MAQKNTGKAADTLIVVAIVVLLGTIIAVFILQQFSNKSERSISSTPIIYNGYDDPSGTFSIEYPAKYAISSRDPSEKSISVVFIRNESLDASAPFGSGGVISVNITAQPGPLDDITKLYDSVVDLFIQKSYMIKYDRFNIETRFVFSEKREKGSFNHIQIILVQDTPLDEYVVDTYILAQFENTISATIIYWIGHESLDNDRDLIEHTFSSFSWSPSKIDEYFNR